MPFRVHTGASRPGRITSAIRSAAGAESILDLETRPDGGWTLTTPERVLVVSPWCGKDTVGVDGPMLGAPLEPSSGRPQARVGTAGGPIEITEIPAVDDRTFERFARRCVRASAVRAVDSGLRPSDLDSLLHLAARGALIELPEPETVAADIGSELVACWSVARCATDDPELRSVHVRRAALRAHGTRAWAQRLAAVTGDRHAQHQPFPEVSVLLATKRPEFVADAVRQVAAQRSVRIQLLVGLHGDVFPSTTHDELAELIDMPLVVHRFPSDVPFGSVLAELTASADVDMVTKWDDDDWYGVDHVADLVLAHDYSGADVVGKRAEFVYLEATDQTIRRSHVGAESIDWSLAGGTLLTTQTWLQEISGWQPVTRGVDRVFLDSTRARGGTSYRTHGFQYVLRRSSPSAHTWAANDEYFLDAAVARRRGRALDWADIGGR